jgi:hypothetical protein
MTSSMSTLQMRSMSKAVAGRRMHCSVAANTRVRPHMRIVILLDGRINIELLAELLLGVDLRIHTFVLERLDEHVESTRKDSAEDGPEPIDPVVRVECVRDDGGAEGARGVDAAARVEDAHELGDEEGEADANRGDECALVLLGGEHEDCEDELSGQEHLSRVLVLKLCSCIFFDTYLDE